MRTTAIGLGLLLVVTACGSSSSDSPEPPALTEQYDCGFGFFLGDDDQEAGLFVSYQDYPGAHEGDVDASASLEDDAWSAELQYGTDLFANWCDDVLEPDEPRSEVDETWQVSGMIEVTELPPAGQCGPARATLTGLKARSDDGDVISLDDLEIQNELWGCIPG